MVSRGWALESNSFAIDVLSRGSAGLSEEIALKQATRKRREAKKKGRGVGSGGRRFSKGQHEGSPLSDLNGFPPDEDAKRGSRPLSLWCGSGEVYKMRGR